MGSSEQTVARLRSRHEATVAQDHTTRNQAE